MTTTGTGRDKLHAMPQVPPNPVRETPADRGKADRAEIAAATRVEDAAADALLNQQEVDALMELTIDPAELAEAVERQSPPDAADTLETLQEEQATGVLEEMDDQAAADALAEMNLPLAISMLDDLIDEEPVYAGLLLELMAPDDAADLLQSLDDERRTRLLTMIDPQRRARLMELMRYDEESAGGMMTTDFLALRADMTVVQAIDLIRASPVPEHTHSALVTDRQGHLIGIVPLRKLLLARPDDTIAAVMDRKVEAVRAAMDREQVAREFDRYGYDMLPVVDEANRLLGIVTVDDVIDIIRAEQTEDVQKTVGAGAGEAVYSTLREKIRSRFPWLLVNLFTSTVAAMVVLQFHDLIGELAVLAVLMPVIANQAGNAGQQSLAVTLRGIVLDEVRSGRIAPLVLREAAVGLFNGLVGGAIVGAVLMLFSTLIRGAGWELGVVAAISMTASLAIGCFVGSSMPIIIRRLGFDPATGSTIFLTMTTDTISFLTFLSTARALSHWLLPGH